MFSIATVSVISNASLAGSGCLASDQVGEDVDQCRVSHRRAGQVDVQDRLPASLAEFVAVAPARSWRLPIPGR
jgi:hypothetical protein